MQYYFADWTQLHESDMLQNLVSLHHVVNILISKAEFFAHISFFITEMTGVLFDDMFLVKNVDPDGKKFDRVSRIFADSESFQ